VTLITSHLRAVLAAPDRGLQIIRIIHDEATSKTNVILDWQAVQ
jgi:hypothetical protein